MSEIAENVETSSTKFEFVDIETYITSLQAGSLSDAQLKEGAIRSDTSWGGSDNYPDENLPAD